MDDILELLNMPSWSDIGGLRNQLDNNSTGVSQVEPAPVPIKSEIQASAQFSSNDLQQRQFTLPPLNCNVMVANEESSLLSNLLPSPNPVFDWRHQPYIGELQSFISSSTGPATSHLYGSRYRSGAPIRLINRDSSRGGAPQHGHSRPPVQTMQASVGRVYRTPPSPLPPTGGAPRPRVRARRGQATDPHSIAERQRRERIAERMKELQVLVPNASKTDKAIMLDEIIEYVKFLQLQAKILEISHQHGTVPSLLPSEYNNTLGQSNGTTSEALSNMERQVARLMDENMEQALQLLQSKGFCLMPIPMATALSAATKGVHQPMDKLETCSTIVTAHGGATSGTT